MFSQKGIHAMDNLVPNTTSPSSVPTETDELIADFAVGVMNGLALLFGAAIAPKDKSGDSSAA